MSVYRHKHRVEAVQYNGSSSHAMQIEYWVMGLRDVPASEGGIHTCDYRSMSFNSPSGGNVTAVPCDWVVKDHRGDFSVYSDQAFTEAFELVE